MKDGSFLTYDRGEARPIIIARRRIDYCINQLYADKTKIGSDDVVKHLAYKELIVALLLARDAIKELNRVKGFAKEIEERLNEIIY